MNKKIPKKKKNEMTFPGAQLIVSIPYVFW